LAGFEAAPPSLPDRPRTVTAVEEPALPDGRVFNVRDHGARGDELHLDQVAMQAAIDACHAAGGGVVLVPAGRYRTGTLVLRDNVRLHLARGATLLGSTNREHYPVPALVTAREARHIAISGAGELDAQGQACPARGWRTNVLLFERCDGLTVEGVTTRNAGAWTQHYIRCRNLRLRGVTVNSPRPARNNDGIDLSGCEEVRIEGCTVVSDDDALVIKSQSADRVNRNIELVGNRCLTYRGAFKLGTETRGTYENITCRDLTAHGAKAVEIYSVDGAAVSGVTVERVRADDALCAVSIRLGARLRQSWAAGEERRPGTLRGIRLRDLDVALAERSYREVLLQHGIVDAETANGQPEAPDDSVISGLPGHLVEDVEITGLRVRLPGGRAEAPTAEQVPERPEAYPSGGMFGPLPAFGLFIRHARDIRLRDLSFRLAAPDVRPAIVEHDTAGVVLERLKVEGGR
ncbi:MAG: hypothetical protein HUU35_12535, partial [Armatimonadetes bacterium]|nr:hypothetical protein [Armatimonadota bacterium]